MNQRSYKYEAPTGAFFMSWCLVDPVGKDRSDGLPGAHCMLLGVIERSDLAKDKKDQK